MMPRFIKSISLVIGIILIAGTGCRKPERIPEVVTKPMSDIFYNEAGAVGEIVDLGEFGIEEHGFCWAMTPYPELSDLFIKLGQANAIGEFSSIIKNLSPGTTYYLRAFVISEEVTYYGESVRFSNKAPVLSTVTTADISDISDSSATVGGNITDDGGTMVYDRGIYYGTSSSPETSGTKLQIGSGTGSFTRRINGLSENTTYYVRAYAMNEIGTSYGDEINFITKDGIAVLTTASVTDITTGSATSGGNITDDGGAAITARGVCWNTTGSPTTTDSKTTDGSGTGIFISNLTGLSENYTYYVRAYATNSYGTGYGQEISFTTKDYLTDYDGNIYETVKLGNQVWMAENLKVTNYPNGSAIPHVTDNTSWANLGDNSTDDAYCFYNNNSSSEYGALYTYAAALNACPAGWHLPSDAEWTELENYLADNGYNYDGTIGGGTAKIAKAMATASGWSLSSTTGAVGNSDYPAKRNASGFSALPGGRRNESSGTFDYAGDYGSGWSSTEYSSSRAYYRNLGYSSAYMYRGHFNKSYGFNVRCIRDN
jgi:uncharacterized protein (TIGR02145 family)